MYVWCNKWCCGDIFLKCFFHGLFYGFDRTATPVFVSLQKGENPFWLCCSFFCPGTSCSSPPVPPWLFFFFFCIILVLAGRRKHLVPQAQWESTRRCPRTAEISTEMAKPSSTLVALRDFNFMFGKKVAHGLGFSHAFAVQGINVGWLHPKKVPWCNIECPLRIFLSQDTQFLGGEEWNLGLYNAPRNICSQLRISQGIPRQLLGFSPKRRLVAGAFFLGLFRAFLAWW